MLYPLPVMSPGVTAGGVEDDWNWMQDKITGWDMLCFPQVRQRAEVDEWGTLRRKKVGSTYWDKRIQEERWRKTDENKRDKWMEEGVRHRFQRKAAWLWMVTADMCDTCRRRLSERHGTWLPLSTQPCHGWMIAAHRKGNQRETKQRKDEAMMQTPWKRDNALMEQES